MSFKNLLAVLALACPTLANAQGLTVTAEPLKVGETATFSASGAAPGAKVAFFVAARRGAGPCVGPVCLGLSKPKLVANATADGAGNAVAVLPVPAGLPIDDYFVQAAHAGSAAQVSNIVRTPALWETDVGFVVNDAVTLELARHLTSAREITFAVMGGSTVELTHYESGGLFVEVGLDVSLPAWTTCTRPGALSDSGLLIGNAVNSPPGEVTVWAPALTTCSVVDIENATSDVTVVLPALGSELPPLTVGPAFVVDLVAFGATVVVDAALLPTAESVVVQRVSGDAVFDMPSLASVTTHDVFPGAGINIMNNFAWSTIDGWFPSVVMADTLWIGQNQGLERVGSIGAPGMLLSSLLVFSNWLLTDVSGLVGTQVTGQLWVADNPMLPSCEAEQLFLLSPNPPSLCFENLQDECADGDDPNEVCTP